MIFMEAVKELLWNILFRNHDLDLAKKQCQDFKNIADFLNQKYGYAMVEVKIDQSYLNMKEHILEHMYIVDNAIAAMKHAVLML